MVLGRPPGLSLDYADCNFPDDNSPHVNSAGEVEFGCKSTASYHKSGAFLRLSCADIGHQTILGNIGMQRLAYLPVLHEHWVPSVFHILRFWTWTSAFVPFLHHNTFRVRLTETIHAMHGRQIPRLPFSSVVSPSSGKPVCTFLRSGLTISVNSHPIERLDAPTQMLPCGGLAGP